MSEEEAPAPKKRGRPPGKRGTFTFRVTAALRTKLETAAAELERPVSEEIEARLDRSFDAELNALRRSMFGDPETEVILRRIVWAARLIEDWNSSEKGNPKALWYQTDEMRAAMRAAVQKIVVDATSHRPVQDPLQALVENAPDDPLLEARDRGLAIGMVLTGNLAPLEVKNLGMGSGTEW